VGRPKKIDTVFMEYMPAALPQEPYVPTADADPAAKLAITLLAHVLASLVFLAIFGVVFYWLMQQLVRLP
jgi:hypothetical protein